MTQNAAGNKLTSIGCGLMGLGCLLTFALPLAFFVLLLVISSFS